MSVVASSADGQWAAIGGSEPEVLLVDLKRDAVSGGPYIVELPGPGQYEQLVFTPSADTLAATTVGGALVTWRVDWDGLRSALVELQPR